MQLILELEPHPDEENLANNHLVVNYTVLAPPRLELLVSEPACFPLPVVAYFPTTLSVELNESAGTPTNGSVWLVTPDGQRIRQAFHINGNQRLDLNLTFIPLAGNNTYRLELKTFDNLTNVSFDLDGQDPNVEYDIDGLGVSPLHPRAGEPLTLILGVKTIFPVATPATIELTLNPVTGGRAIILPVRNLTLINGNNPLSWTMMVPPGKYDLSIAISIDLEHGPDPLWRTILPGFVHVPVEGKGDVLSTLSMTAHVIVIMALSLFFISRRGRP